MHLSKLSAMWTYFLHFSQLYMLSPKWDKSELIKEWVLISSLVFLKIQWNNAGTETDNN